LIDRCRTPDSIRGFIIPIPEPRYPNHELLAD
jgi:hypothetical protein